MTSRNLAAARIVFILILSSSLSQPNADAGTILPASDIGWYNSVGDHPKFAKSVMMGYAGNFDTLSYRSYMVFELPATRTLFTSASLEIWSEAGGYDSPDSAETINFYALSTPLASLMYGQTGATGIFNDLGTGTILGSMRVTPAQGGSWISFNLDADSLSRLNGYRGSKYSMGAAVASLGHTGQKVNELVFTNSLYASTVRLVLNSNSSFFTAALAPVPEPSTLFGAAMAIGSAALAYSARRRNKTKA